MVAETVPDVSATSSVGLVAPAGTPSAVIARISSDIARSVRTKAFADRLLLNKVDLVDEAELANVEAQLREVNKYAPIVRCEHADAAMDDVINLHAFELERVLEMDPEFLSDGEHQHDSTVYSVGFETRGDLDLERVNSWFATLLRDKGTDIYRMKGVLAIAGSEQKFVFQGVHMLFTGEPLGAWKVDEPRLNRLVFIGKNLDREDLKSSFDQCRAAI